VFRVRDAVFAIGNYDPASDANVLSRGIVGDIGGEIVVASPIYKQHFSLITGRCLEEPRFASLPIWRKFATGRFGCGRSRCCSVTRGASRAWS